MKKLTIPFRSISIDLLFLVGLALISFGAYEIYIPAGLITFGLFIVIIAAASDPRKRKQQS